MNEIQLAYDAAALQGVFNNAAIALAIVAVVLLALWAAEFRLRQLLELVAWSVLVLAAIVVVAWLCLGVWWGLI
ncbi:Na+/H+-dicarboxylate symporter [Bradyrhizobium japonicum]|uniref:hypothetical protein n=1 Tax=Bradyrhizobium elkanii TaxID=29448 RepID=UPI00036E145D|nr:hypothetical protein [Bradyrhizobium elkanii]WAX24370.1 hypothetical protein [Bradyrhizobium phage ppBeUSDA76-1]MCP1731253.1 Na+/H+-dicarboxylate symporter [Bradyrhizobium elkanii]MCS3575382.1 Na+/H+-dicarboxylate symporter [Bradyrhizobium elkanii]MCS3591927.1 Na+/H+-dicarboxylate symporter [Bradyrhizobium elkanii]MCS3621372.1 Na+/H+-dicarboxylate symporter [Bradyrhizobium elkanii]